MKYLLALLLITSCATPRKAPKPHPIHGFKTKQQKMIECYEMLKRMGEDGKQASSFCTKIFKERI